MILIRNMPVFLAILALAYGFFFDKDKEEKKESFWSYFKGLFGHGKKKDSEHGASHGGGGGIPGYGGLGYGAVVLPVYYHHHHHHHHYKDNIYASPSHKSPPSYIYKWKR